MCSGAVTLDFLWVLVFFIFYSCFPIYEHIYFFFASLHLLTHRRSAIFFYSNSLKLFTFLLSLYCSDFDSPLYFIFLLWLAVQSIDLFDMLFTGVNVFHSLPFILNQLRFHLTFSVWIWVFLVSIFFSSHIRLPKVCKDVVFSACTRIHT